MYHNYHINRIDYFVKSINNNIVVTLSPRFYAQNGLNIKYCRSICLLFYFIESTINISKLRS